MTLPGFNVVFDPYFDALSVPESVLSIPDYYDQFVPDNTDDFQCVNVLSPNPNLGAQQWTINGQWITIGIYRDEGRPATLPPAVSNLTWSRFGTTITFTTIAPHYLNAGDPLNVANVNVSLLQNAAVTSVIGANSFIVQCPNMGDTSGSSGAYQAINPINFYETYRVFRLLPSFKLVPYSVIQSLFAAAAPPSNTTLRTLYNISTASNQNIPNGSSKASNYNLPYKQAAAHETQILSTRFNQAYDETGAPLKQSYDVYGMPVIINEVDSKYKNSQVFYNQPIGGSSDSILQVYDYYGLGINDVTRGPYFSSTIVTRDSSNPSNIGNFLYQENNDQSIYPQTENIFDLFGNIAIGVQASNNAPIIRKCILPLTLDAFNRPIKAPILKQGVS